ncbi:hypothetical protein [Ectothiorhodospira variabilis]|uniref:hypothetical protein n=1 Tax=Ectothiorhodospira variabilis TaxID=505694 RepID=UPI001EFA7830|nr:hypothetical protein [Ectothiorhodospira variabilis]MCG5493566.1 hypothetical protein [Ectothiorhodospira variabilis]MCG5502895.1 hypothetical protein [Ectothiorhodospira variabilis]MCG5506317.1 hypothetical protein [Ectothiorhodospira variabilis]
MPRPRCQQISVTETPYYHVVSRCVRRTFLSGQDHATGKSFEHRRQWIEDRIRLLASLFAVEVAAYAVMSNHYQLVVKLEPTQAERWSDDEVLRRWSCLFKGPLLVQRYLAGASQESYELSQVAEFAQCYRRRLADLSWFMKCLNEPIARQANRDGGHPGGLGAHQHPETDHAPVQPGAGRARADGAGSPSASCGSGPRPRRQWAHGLARALLVQRIAGRPAPTGGGRAGRPAAAHPAASGHHLGSVAGAEYAV